MRRPRPRTLGVVSVCLILLAASVVTAVRWAQNSGSVTLLANWSGEEEEQFQGVIEQFEKDHGIEVIYQGSSALSQVLAAGIAAGAPPDVAVLPGPGELLTYAAQGNLQPLDGLFQPEHYDTIWAPEVLDEGQGKHRYWLPIKTSLKSMVWHSGRLSKAEVAEIATAPENWCLAMESGATSGWPGTDWVEDILLQQAGPETYEKWANGDVQWTDESVRKAWTTWGEMMGTEDEKRMKQALTENYGKNCSEGRLEHQGSFRASRSEKASAEYLHSSVVIPGAGTPSWEVSGDLVVMLNGTPEAKELIRYLANPKTDLPDYTVNKQAELGYEENPTNKEIGQVLRTPKKTRCWDASDVMPGPMRDAFYHAVLHYLIAPEKLEDQLETLEEVRGEVRKEEKARTNNQQDRTKPPVCD